jgi:hypothetical protein
MGYTRDTIQQLARPERCERFVVTNAHPALFRHLNTTSSILVALQKAGARPVARFAGTPDTLPPEVAYDPIDADYAPLRGWSALERPGPNVTIWHLPAPDA